MLSFISFFSLFFLPESLLVLCSSTKKPLFLTAIFFHLFLLFFCLIEKREIEREGGGRSVERNRDIHLQTSFTDQEVTPCRSGGWTWSLCVVFVHGGCTCNWMWALNWCTASGSCFLSFPLHLEPDVFVFWVCKTWCFIKSAYSFCYYFIFSFQLGGYSSWYIWWCAWKC